MTTNILAGALNLIKKTLTSKEPYSLLDPSNLPSNFPDVETLYG
jgi:hypothetical protein